MAITHSAVAANDVADTPPPMKVLWACTGSVATVKVPECVVRMRAEGHEVKVVCTPRARFMLLDGPAKKYNAAAFQAFVDSGVRVLCDEDEWPADYAVSDGEVLHIELRKWADALCIAPLSANMLAKLALGLSDNLVSCIARAWDETKPIVVAPAMNTLMWTNPHTTRHLAMLPAYYHVVPPVSKTLACKDTGVGAMAAVDDVCRALLLVSRL